MKTTRLYLLAFGTGLLVDLLTGNLLGRTAIIFLVIAALVIWLKKFFLRD